MLKKLFFAILLSWSFILCASASAVEQLRVALVTGQATAEISCEDDFEVVSGWQKTVMPKGKYFLHSQDGMLQFDDQHKFGGSVYVRALPEKALPQINKRSYKGYLRALVQRDKLLVVNYIDMEDYLASVLPAKTMVVWPDEAVKAQAVAARSYALYMRHVNSGRDYDLTATDSELQYAGTGPRIEKDGVTRLIRETEGEYLQDAAGDKVQADRTSSRGGKTQAEVNLWGKEVG